MQSKTLSKDLTSPSRTPSSSISENKNPMLSKFQDQDENFDGDLDLDEKSTSFQTPNKTPLSQPNTLDTGKNIIHT